MCFTPQQQQQQQVGVPSSTTRETMETMETTATTATTATRNNSNADQSKSSSSWRLKKVLAKLKEGNGDDKMQTTTTGHACCSEAEVQQDSEWTDQDVTSFVLNELETVWSQFQDGSLFSSSSRNLDWLTFAAMMLREFQGHAQIRLLAVTLLAHTVVFMPTTSTTTTTKESTGIFGGSAEVLSSALGLTLLPVIPHDENDVDSAARFRKRIVKLLHATGVGGSWIQALLQLVETDDGDASNSSGNNGHPAPTLSSRLVAMSLLVLPHIVPYDFATACGWIHLMTTSVHKYSGSDPILMTLVMEVLCRSSCNNKQEEGPLSTSSSSSFLEHAVTNNLGPILVQALPDLARCCDSDTLRNACQTIFVLLGETTTTTTSTRDGGGDDGATTTHTNNNNNTVATTAVGGDNSHHHVASSHQEYWKQKQLLLRCAFRRQLMQAELIPFLVQAMQLDAYNPGSLEYECALLYRIFVSDLQHHDHHSRRHQQEQQHGLDDDEDDAMDDSDNAGMVLDDNNDSDEDEEDDYDDVDDYDDDDMAQRALGVRTFCTSGGVKILSRILMEYGQGQPLLVWVVVAILAHLVEESTRTLFLRQPQQQQPIHGAATPRITTAAVMMQHHPHFHHVSFVQEALADSLVLDGLGACAFFYSHPHVPRQQLERQRQRILQVQLQRRQAEEEEWVAGQNAASRPLFQREPDALGLAAMRLMVMQDNDLNGNNGNNGNNVNNNYNQQEAEEERIWQASAPTIAMGAQMTAQALWVAQQQRRREQHQQHPRNHDDDNNVSNYQEVEWEEDEDPMELTG